MRSEYLRRLGRLERPAAALVLDYLRNWDRRKSSGVTHFVAVSRNVQERIKDAYGRESVIIHPPVDCARFGLSETNDGYYLIVSALVPYKRLDLAVEAFGGLDRELRVVGNGPELNFLKGMAPDNVSFVDDADDSEVVEYMQKCRALIFPGEEDFGIVPLEAQSCGKPVIAFGKGGAMETVVGIERNRKGDKSATGMFFHEHSPQALQRTILKFEERESQFDGRACRSNALRFDRPTYKRTMQDYILNVLDEYTCMSEE
jgi:glycosyltransferase involved in cell wall biosynthesis